MEKLNRPPGTDAPATASPEAFLLAAVAGGVDAVGFVTFAGLFVAHMSGNSAALGAWFGQGIWEKALPHLFAVPVFVTGLTAGYLATLRNKTFRRSAALLLIEAGFLSAFLVWHVMAGRPTFLSVSYFLMASLLLLAMGMQNATLRQIGRSGFPSTYVTGILDTFARSAASVISARLRGEQSETNRRTAMSAGGLWACYVTGAITGSAGLYLIGAWILILPVLVLTGIGVWFLQRNR